MLRDTTGEYMAEAAGRMPSGRPLERAGQESIHQLVLDRADLNRDHLQGRRVSPHLQVPLNWLSRTHLVGIGIWIASHANERSRRVNGRTDPRLLLLRRRRFPTPAARDRDSA